jgi:hypothetical protein
MKKETGERISGTKSPGRRTYEKPSFQHEHVFETMALSCGKISATQLQCKTNRQAS